MENEANEHDEKPRSSSRPNLHGSDWRTTRRTAYRRPPKPAAVERPRESPRRRSDCGRDARRRTRHRVGSRAANPSFACRTRSAARSSPTARPSAPAGERRPWPASAFKKGTGKITVNGRAFEEYFPVERHRLLIEAPFKATGVFGQVDVWVRATGGGVNGQAGAVILGVARAIQALHPEQHGALSDGGFLTRDDRMVERKKYGHRKARRSFQFSKR